MLRVESSAANLDGGQLTTTYLDNVGDEGVDAGLRRAVRTKFIPSGDSAWQFKAGDLSPSKSRKELHGASAALRVLRNGGTYRLVLGADLTDTQVGRRRVALEEEAAVLGIDVRAGMFEVLNASDLATWAEEHPALAVSPLLRGIDNVAHPFALWSASNRHTGPWVDAPSRVSVTKAVREFVTGSNSLDLHIEGVSGVGKTRAVLEAIRGQDFEPLVAYVYAADVLPPTLIHQLQTQARHTILVVDECDAKRHETLAQQLPAGSPVRLITIGEPAGDRPRAESVLIEPLDDDALRQVLHQNQPALWHEHARFVVDASAGNVRLALLLADAIIKQPSSTANDLITSNVISSYVTQALPTGREFLACCALAVFPYFGYAGEPSAELTTLATAFDLTVTDLRAAVRHLANAGLLSEQGRYRSVSPHPLAIYLAARGWEDFHEHIVTRLLPAIDNSMTVRLFQRAADIGDFQVTKEIVGQLLEPGGPYENVDLCDRSGEGLLILHFAALAPAATCGYMEAVLAGMSDDDLSDHPHCRRSVTWVFERLAWRTATFRRAADGLLRVASVIPRPGADDDHAARSWTGLFGTLLPTTATSPNERAQYLGEVATSADRRHRLLAAAAAGRALDTRETVVASAEMQGGVLVERRGRPATWGDVFTYREAAIDVLDVLARDDDAEVANLATGKLVDCIHPYLGIDRIRRYLASVITDLPDTGLTAVRTEITHLTALFERVNDDVDNGIDARNRGLEELVAQLPPATPEQTIEFLANTRRWDLSDGELQQRLRAAAAAISVQDRVSLLLSALDPEPEAAYEIGHALGELSAYDDVAQERLVELAANDEQGAALVGYLCALVEGGASDAFDQLLDFESSGPLGDLARLRVSVRGPQSDAGWARVSVLITRLSPADGARGLFGWHVDLDTERLRTSLADWLPRIDAQDDYNAVVDFVALALHRRSEWIASVDPLVADLVALRSRFGALAKMEWEWEQLARRQLIVKPAELLTMLLDLVDAGEYDAHSGPGEQELLRDAVVATGGGGWRQMIARLDAESDRVRAAAGHWLGDATDIDTVRAWVSESVERARLVASVATPGYEQVTAVARYLIDHFGSDQQVSESLRSALIPVGWFGQEVDPYDHLINRVKVWIAESGESSEVVAWARSTLAWLQTCRDAASKRSAEPGW